MAQASGSLASDGPIPIPLALAVRVRLVRRIQGSIEGVVQCVVSRAVNRLVRGTLSETLAIRGACRLTFFFTGSVPRSRVPSPSVLRKRAPVELEESDSESQVSSPHDATVASAGGREDDDDDAGDAVNNSAGEEEEMDDLFDYAGGAEPKAREDVRAWHELREQIKSDLEMTHKENSPITRINQYTILRNFATLRIKGRGRMAASEDIAQQWHEGKGVHFSRRVRFLARHYQLFEQLPVEKRGGNRGHSLLNNEQVQSASRAYLTSLATGEVTPSKFQRALNERILPTPGLELKGGLSERTAARWLVKLGWRSTKLKKGIILVD